MGPRRDMLAVRYFANLDVWKRAHRLALAIYDATKAYPRDERFGLIAQMRRAAVSIPSNVAEGSGRGTRADYARFLSIAIGSSSELEYQVVLAKDLGYQSPQAAEDLRTECREIRAMLTSLRQRVLAED